MLDGIWDFLNTALGQTIAGTLLAGLIGGIGWIVRRWWNARSKQHLQNQHIQETAIPGVALDQKTHVHNLRSNGAFLKGVMDRLEAKGASETKLKRLENALRDLIANRSLAEKAPEDVERAVQFIEDRLNSLETELHAARNSATPQSDILDNAQAAFDAGNLEETGRLLAAFEEAVARWAQEQQEQFGRVTADRVRALQQRAELEMIRLDFVKAADLFDNAVTLMPAGDPDARWNMLVEAAKQLHEAGDRFGYNGALERAIEFCRRAIDVVPRAVGSDKWAQAQYNLGKSLWVLGERESGRQRLEEAVAACRAALEERTRERAPQDWAATQNTLGNAFKVLGERESGTQRLEAAVGAYRAALKEYSREYTPLQWATIQHNLGNALAGIGERGDSVDSLKEAIVAYRAALEERTRERTPRRWAATEIGLGHALLRLGERESGTDRLKESVEAERLALEELARERVPLLWAMAQNNLGNALQVLGERERAVDRLEESVGAYRAALEERTRERVPLDWAGTQTNLGNALRTLGEWLRDCARLKEARVYHSHAIDVYEQADADYYIEIAKRNLGLTETVLTRVGCVEFESEKEFSTE